MLPAQAPGCQLLACCKAASVPETPWTGECKARGVFAETEIGRGDLIETAHCILVPRDEYETYFRHTVLEHYLFRTPSGDHLLALGAGSLFNHSAQPNVDYRVDGGAVVVRFYAARPVAAGEELTIFYGSKLWFVDRNASDSMQGHMDCADTSLAAVEL
ncbi:hypothetical protein WJX81_002342 [Elliptochloris bilobata]|uniref:SET domain-containing protein n=1 Tax=Elliptochloris bilobata TaxID=381761 RepID=A0AAW1R4D7_9CHLO